MLSVELGGVLSLETVRLLSVAALSLKVLSLEVLSQRGEVLGGSKEQLQSFQIAILQIL